MRTYDLLVIGGGSAGVACSRRAASYGKKVAIFEHKRLGGTCVNVGCVPKKVTYNAAEIANSLKIAAEYGFKVGPASFEYSTFKQKRDAYIERLNGIYSKKLNDLDVEIVSEKAEFVSNKVVKAGDNEYSAPTIVIAAGGEPNDLDIPGHELFLNSDQFFDKLDFLPKKVAVIGGGYIGVELAGALNALGSDVTLICRRKKVLFGFDKMLRETVMTEMAENGVAFRMRTHIAEAHRAADQRISLATAESGVLCGFDAVLCAVGRHSVCGALALGRAGVALDARGNVRTDEWERTTADGVFALGDVNGKKLLTPVAVAAGRALADRLFGGRDGAKMDYGCVPSVVFSHPVMATVGLTEDEAVGEYGADGVKTYTSTFVNMFFAMSAKKPKTKYKIVCTLPGEKVVGLHMIGAASDEIMQGFAVAIKMGATKSDFDRCVAIHPTAAEELVTMV